MLFGFKMLLLARLLIV